ncbi:Prostaglandin E synthase 3 (Cytosolic), partial [Thoreauomyces humboldtii]
STTTLIPEVLWAQRADELFITVNVSDVQQPRVELTETGLSFSGTAHGKEYKLDLPFFKEVDVENSKQNISLRNLSFVIAKKEKGQEYWPRVTKDKGRFHWLKTDFAKWRDEDEDDEEVAPGQGGAGAGFDGMDFSQFQVEHQHKGAARKQRSLTSIILFSVPFRAWAAAAWAAWAAWSR